MERVWQEFLTIVREEVGSRVIDTWFKAIVLDRWDPQEKVVHLRAPNRFVCDWVERRYAHLFSTHLGRLLNVAEPRVVFSDARAALKEEKQEPDQQGDQVTMVPARVIEKQTRSVGRYTDRQLQTGINERYTFDTFVVGSSNSLAYAAAKAVAEHPGSVYNPLFIYGDSGLGKTHLLHAIGNEVRTLDPRATILYQTTDRFVTDFINAIRFDKVHTFQKKYQLVDLFLIDDVQFICNKEQTQEAFFHIFNTLHDARKQIVFSSDTFPQNMNGIAERLRSRFAWGLVTDIHVPHLETRIAILKKKAAFNGAEVSDEVLHYIASLDVGNIRELEGALVRVVAYASLIGHPITVTLAQKALNRVSRSASVKEVGFDRIIEHVCRQYSYTIDDLRSKNRNKELAHVRHIAIFLMKKMSDRSLRDIGKFLGGRDHSTVAHALEKVTEQLKHEPEIRARIESIERSITRNA